MQKSDTGSSSSYGSSSYDEPNSYADQYGDPSYSNPSVDSGNNTIDMRVISRQEQLESFFEHKTKLGLSNYTQAAKYYRIRPK